LRYKITMRTKKIGIAFAVLVALTVMTSIPVVAACRPAEGLTPGFWKNRGVRTGAWVGYSPTDTVLSVFGSDVLSPLDSATLLEALSFGGGPGVLGAQKILLRAAVAGLLNAAHPDINFDMTPTTFLNQYVLPFLSGNRAAILDQAEIIDGWNNLGNGLD
jgi:hypothetical protein